MLLTHSFRMNIKWYNMEWDFGHEATLT
jgi:hypothetical protein